MATAKASKRTQGGETGPNKTRGPGRRSKRTEENRKLLEEAIGRYGMTDKSACEYAGIGHETFYTWLREDPEMAEGIARARAKFKAHHLRIICDHAERDARHSEWLLSHRFADEYAERQQIDASVGQASPLDKLFSPAPGEGTADYKSQPPGPDIVNGQPDDSPDA